MTDTAALKKGLPPKRDGGTIIDDDRGDQKNKPLQITIPSDMFERFSEEAGKMFGFQKGAKSKMFMMIFEYYISYR